ncbi:hypothetical protein P0Y35_13240 [Kiritimatiellaeota bacterium B1221]|nr:hypothetical protein [Kiritimatiellaeota bacterium B1221]
MYSSFTLFIFGSLLMLLVGCRGLAENSGVAEKLRDARVEVTVAEGAYQRVEAQFKEMQKDPAASPEEILAMEAYVNELDEMLQLRKSTLEDLQRMSGEKPPEVDPAVTEGMAEFHEAIDQVPDTAGPESEEAKLEREFLASLQEFDGMILNYNEKLEAQMDARITQGEVAAGKQQSAVEEAEALLQSMGVETGIGPKGKGEPPSGAAHPGGSSGGPQGEPGMEAGGEPGTEATGGGAQVAAQGGKGSASGGSGDRAPVEDEDIVARQLREAAEKETDPVLREKLWKEYEAYLDGQS